MRESESRSREQINDKEMYLGEKRCWHIIENHKTQALTRELCVNARSRAAVIYIERSLSFFVLKLNVPLDAL